MLALRRAWMEKITRYSCRSSANRSCQCGAIEKYGWHTPRLITGFRRAHNGGSRSHGNREQLSHSFTGVGRPVTGERMPGLVQMPDHCDPLPSIPDLTAPSCGTRKGLTAITAGDLAFLKALYYENTGLGPTLSRDDMESSMLQQFKGH